MSGVYLTLWDKELKDRSLVLRPVKSGWAHLTVAYTDKLMPVTELVKISQTVLAIWAMRTVTLTKAYVNTFDMIPTGKVRHDVLIEVDPQTTEAVWATRQTHLSPYDGSEQFVMRNPHTTHSIHDSRESAEAMVETLNREHLPRTVYVTGVTVD